MPRNTFVLSVRRSAGYYLYMLPARFYSDTYVRTYVHIDNVILMYTVTQFKRVSLQANKLDRIRYVASRNKFARQDMRRAANVKRRRNEEWNWN